MHSTPHACFLLTVIICSALTEPVNCVKIKQFVKGGKIYRFPDHVTEYEEAERFCEEEGGRLAKVTNIILTNDRDDPFYQFLDQEYVFWIGMSDRDNEGEWKWNDGEPVTSVDWEEEGWWSVFERFTSDCGSMVNDLGKWNWRKSKCFHLYRSLCEYEEANVDMCRYTCTNSAPPESTSQAALCEDTDQCATKGKIFKVPDQRTDFANAETFCEKDGGRLAKIRLNVVTDDTKSPLSQFFLSHFGPDCAWIGMSDRESEGDWVWNDGKPVYLMEWMSGNLFTNWFTSRKEDCGRLCFAARIGSDAWKGKKSECDIISKFVCEYEDPDTEHCIEKCRAPGTPPISTLKENRVKRHKRQPVREKRTVVVRSRKSSMVTGEPMFTMFAHSVPMCSRVCMKTDSCSILSFNLVTKVCKAYTSTKSGCFKKHPDWEIWTVEEVYHDH